ncbi:ATP-binding cassette domain-containing protein, partial [Pectobacterium parmentieri]|nr:ATP-binding cassette domain-containing protein [Pectobacterium parmentieri]
FALVGENGAGKSTIVKLLLRFIEPISGEILINGIPIKEFEIESYRNAISVIFQNFMRYGLSAKDNIFANQDISKYNNIDSILSSPFFKKLPNQENTQLNMGFGGYDISGGEWQRIAVMRALSKPYSLFIADEPTANIDPIEEYNIFQTIIKKTKGIRLIITHRMGSIKNCDEIFVLRNG